MPVVAAAVAYAVDYAVVELGIAAAIEATVGAGIVATATTGAIVGATTAAITGGDVGKGALMGGVGSTVASQFQTPKSMESFGKQQYPGEFAKNIGGDITQASVEAGLSRGVAQGVSTGAGRFAAGTAAGVAGGEDVGTAAERGLMSAGTGVAKDILFPVDDKSSKTDKAVSEVGRELFDFGTASLFSQDKSGVGATSFTQGQPSSVTTGGAGSPGSEALAQALRLDPGAPVFGGEKDKGKKSGWNVESLRYMGNSEA